MNLGSKDGSADSPRPKVNSTIMSAAGLAFNQAKNQDFHGNTPLTDKVPMIKSRSFADSLKAFNTEAIESPNQSDSTGSSSDEAESSNSSITRVEQHNTINRPKARTDSIISSSVSNMTGGHSDDANQHKDTEKDTVPKKARAKVSANMIISDFNSIRFPQKQGQNDDSTLCSPTLRNQLDSRSEVSRSSDPSRNNAARRPRVNTTMIHEESENSRYRQNTNSEESSRKVFFNPSSDAPLNYARSDVSWGSDPGQNTNTKRSMLKSNDDIIHQYNHENSSFNTNEWTTRPSRVKSKAFVEFDDSSHYQSDSFSHNIQYQLNPRYNTRSPPSTPKTWSDVAYRQVEARTELSNRSDPGPPGHLFRTSDNILSRVPDAIDEHGTFNSNYQPNTKSRRPRVSVSSIVDVTNIQSNPRKAATYSQRGIVEDEDYESEDKYNYDDGGDNNDEPVNEVEENPVEEQDEDQEELRELMSLSSDPKIQRKFLDLRISNKSLMSINATLSATVEDQSNKIASLTSFESIVASQQQQLDHIIKIEELLRVMSNKISEQETDIKSLKSQIGEASEEKQKGNVTLFYDPKLLPLNSLPRIIFDRAYDDVTVLFTVITSLLYTIYIFPVIVLAKSAKRLAERSRAKIQEITG